jgi:hypothetical protein
MFTMHDLEGHYSTRIKVNEITFKLVKDDTMAGIQAAWVDADIPWRGFVAYANPDWEGYSIITELYDGEGELVGSENCEQEINSFDEYIEVVKISLKRILDKL